MNVPLLQCEGAPRDQGLAQGLACRAAVRDRAARHSATRRRPRWPSLGPLLRGPSLGGGTGREWVRHYAHLAERTDGIALGADLSLSSAVELALRGAGAVRALASPQGPPRGLAALLPTGPWILRRSRPEVGFVSVEVARPWLAGAVAGVNEHGLAAAVSVDSTAGTASGMVQESLQRFAELESALAWCMQRPVAGGGRILLAQAGAGAARVSLDGAARAVDRSEKVSLALCASRDAEREAEACFVRDAGDPARGLDALARPEGGPSSRLWIDLDERELHWPADGSGSGIRPLP